MESVSQQQATNWVASLQGFVAAQQAAVERCELCSAEIGDGHPHLIEPENPRRLHCACPTCALLFADGEGRKYRRVPRNVTRLQDFKLSDAQWDAFSIPINMAFFFRSSVRKQVLAMYPGPAGATESTLELGAWDDLAEENPILKALEEDVEALLVNRVEGTRDYYRVPIDRCYELVGVLRNHWRGISGGQGAHEAIGTFFAHLQLQACNRGEPAHA